MPGLARSPAALVAANMAWGTYAVDAATFACAVSGPATATVTEQIASMHLRRGSAGAAVPSQMPEGA